MTEGSGDLPVSPAQDSAPPSPAPAENSDAGAQPSSQQPPSQDRPHHQGHPGHPMARRRMPQQRKHMDGMPSTPLASRHGMPQHRHDNRGDRPTQRNDRPPHGPGRFERHDHRHDRPFERGDHPDHAQPVATGPGMRLDDLYRLPIPQLFSLAEQEGMNEHAGMNRGQLIVGIARRLIDRGEPVRGSGTLEILPDGFGFLRSTAHNYLASPEDIYVSPSQVRRSGLRNGQVVEGPIRLPIEGQENFALYVVESVNGKPAENRGRPTVFEDLTPHHPNKRLKLESSPDEMATRVIDLVTPIGKGQRALIVSPPRAGKTVLLSKIAQSIRNNHPECYLIVLLIDERPEEVTEMQRQVCGANVEVVASTFDEPSGEHTHVSEIALEKAKRMVEEGKDVVILLDSITRLARAHNTEAPSGGKLLSGGLDSNAMQKPKRFFGAARQVEEGGSLTIIATALIDTGSRMDEVIFEEFKGTGNMELHLDRRLVDKRVWPAIDINRSGTRKEELLLTSDEVERMRILRRVLADMPPVEAMELLLNKLKKSKTNHDFLANLNMM